MVKKFFILVFTFTLFGCERKPLYVAESAIVEICVAVDANIDEYWPSGWRNNLIYNLDEDINYHIDNMDIILVFLNNGSEVKRIETKTNTKTNVELSVNTRYDILVYSKTKNTINDDYNVFLKRSEIVIDSKIANKYTGYDEPGEIYSVYLQNIVISDDFEVYDVKNIDGKNVYVLNMDVKLKPFSYLYIIQFIFDGDDGFEPEVDNINSYTISGIIASKNLLSNEGQYLGLSQIMCNNVIGKQIINECNVFASTFTILDIYGDNDSSWSSIENNHYYTVISVETKNFGTLNGVVDITNQLLNNPKGGVISIRIKNSDIKKNQPETGGFGITVSEWEEKIIDIPF